ELTIGDLHDDAAVILHAEQTIGGHGAYSDRIESPLAEDVEHFAFPALLGDQQHALLRFGQHDLIRRHAGFALRHVLQVDLDADAAAPAHLAGGASEPGRAHVLNAHDGAGLHGFETGFDQQLFEERIAHLHVRALLLRFLGEFGRRHGGPGNPGASRLGANVDYRIPDTCRLGIKDLIGSEHTQREHVHQRIAVIALLENAFAAHRGNAEAVAIMGDAGHHAFEDAAIARAGYGI